MKAETFGKPETAGEEWVLRELENQAINHEHIIYCRSSLVYNKDNGEPRTATPDFVIIVPSKGYFVLEVKDWGEITKASQNQARADGKWKGSPVVQAHNAAEILNMNLQGNRAIADALPPYYYAGILPFIDQAVIRWLTHDNHWGAGRLFGRKDVLKAAFFQTLMKARLRRPWKAPMSETPLTAASQYPAQTLLRLRFEHLDHLQDFYSSFRFSHTTSSSECVMIIHSERKTCLLLD